MPAPAADDDRYNPEAIFRNFDPDRRWYILVVDPGSQERVAERARPAGIDVYFPQTVGIQTVRHRQVETVRPSWGRYVAGAVQIDRKEITIAHALGVRGVTEILGGEDGRPYPVPGVQIHAWWIRQTKGDLDDSVKVGRHRFPRWCRKGYKARIVGGMTTFFAKAIEGIIVSLESTQKIGVEVEFAGATRVVHTPLVFLEKAR